MIPDAERSCYGKARYGDESHAKKVARRVFYQRGTKLRVYACFVCGGYHLTKLTTTRARR